MKQLITTSFLSLAAAMASGQVFNQWNFNDTAGTDLGSAVDSVGSATFSSDLGGGGPLTTNGSGQLVGLARFGNADIADVSSGVYQFDLTGVTMSSMAGGTDDNFGFGMRSDSVVINTQFDAFDSTNDQAFVVFGNENDAGGLDLKVYNGGSDLGILNDVTADFSGTFDFRIVLDFDNDTADYLYQKDGGGYVSIVPQQANSVATITHLGIASDGFGATVSVDQATWTAVPEPSTYALLSGVLVLGLVMLRRRMR